MPQLDLHHDMLDNITHYFEIGTLEAFCWVDLAWYGAVLYRAVVESVFSHTGTMWFSNTSAEDRDKTGNS